jgi:hypothetical protein
MKKSVTWIIAICIIVSMIAFIQATDFERVVSAIQKVGCKFSLLLLVTFVAYLFGTISWQCCLGEHSGVVSTGKLFLIRHVGETVSLFNPASIIGGDAVKTFMLSTYRIDNRKVLISVLLSRMIMVFTQLLLFITAIVMLVIQNPGHVMLVFHGGKLAGVFSFMQLKAGSLCLKIKEARAELPLLLKLNREMLVLSCVFALLHWIFGSLEFYFILKFMGLKVSVTQALVVDMGVIFFKAAGAFIPGQIGIEEYGNKIMLMAIGIPDAEVWITASILRRARQLVWVAFGIGVYFLIFKKRKVLLQE